MPLPDAILEESSTLFHDTSPETIDPELHAAFVIERVLDRGSSRSVGALVRFYGLARIRRSLCDGGLERLARRTAPLWTAFLNLTADECTPKSSPRRSSPFWTF